MITLNYTRAMDYLNYCLIQNRPYSLNPDRCYYDLENSREQRLLRFRYPLCTPVFKTSETLQPYLKTPPPYVILLIQAGNAALATVVNGQITRHKVISKYVTRKKQGKAQINYLKTKGKSRAGSRIRLANTRLFFEEVIDWLNRWQSNGVTTILYNTTPAIWGRLFSEKQKPPFDKNDTRLRKIPIDIGIPRYTKLQFIQKKIESGWIELNPDLQNPYEKELRMLWDGKLTGACK